MDSTNALVYRTHGIPNEVLEWETRPLPPLGAREVKLKMRAAVIHPSDFGMIGGNYGRLPELPAIAGREGVAEVVEKGDDVTEVDIGDFVRMPENAGTWQTGCVAPADQLYRIPSDVSLEMAAMAFVNPPTAWRLLRDAHLNDGEWVIQNAANSAVGIFVMQMAKHLGLRTLNVVRREELVEPLKRMGGDVVVTETSGYEKEVRGLTEKGHIPLALNSVGGESAIRQIKCLSPGGIQMTFGAMSFETVRFPTRHLIFNGITMKGFWMDKWYRENSAARVQVMYDKIFDLMKKEVLTPPVAETFPLVSYREALEMAKSPRLGKVLLTNA